MNTPALVSLTVFFAAVVWMLGVWAYDTRQRRKAADVSPPPVSLAIETDQPLTAVDVAAIHHLLTHAMGTDVAEELMPHVYAAVAEHAAKDLEDDLRKMGGAA